MHSTACRQRYNHSLSQSGQAIYSLHPSTLAQWHSTVIIAAAELLLITKKETSYEIGENPTPYVWDIYAGHYNARLFKMHQSDLLNSHSTNQISFGRLIQLLIQTMLLLSCPAYM